MFDLAQHLTKARYLPDLAPDVTYRVEPTLFYGSFRKAEPNDMRDKTVHLYTPGFTQKRQVLGLAVEKREKELLRYYTEVLQAARQHRKELNTLGSYFGIQPALSSKSKVLLSCPWPGTYPGAAGFLRAVQAPDDRSLFSDLDQGWQLELYGHGNKLYVAEGGGDDDRPALIYYTDRDRFRHLAAAALARTQQQVALFVRATGQNPWQYSGA